MNQKKDVAKKFQDGEPRIYECEIRLKPQEILHVSEDWGSPTHQGNFRGFCIGIGCMDMVNGRQGKYLAKHDPRWLEDLQKEANERGFAAMSYLNAVENLPGKNSLSWMVIDHQRIQILGYYVPTWIEIYNTLEQFDPSNLSGVDWNLMMAKAREQANITP